jgi:hypothetical protein
VTTQALTLRKVSKREPEKVPEEVIPDGILCCVVAAALGKEANRADLELSEGGEAQRDDQQEHGTS